MSVPFLSAARWPIVGHEWAVSWLQQSLLADRFPHALLITGPAQVGKRTLALATAAALNCQGEPKPCGRCRSCRKVAHGTHPDVRLVQAEAGKSGREGILKIDQVRELQREAALAPMEGRYKVFILRELERANLPAANALLKTLEEPPASVVLLLTSVRPHALLPTVVSRCQVLALRPLPIAQVAEALRTRWGGEAEQAELLARLSGGRLGWAVERLTDGRAWEERAQRLQDLARLLEEGRAARLAYAEALSRSPDAVVPTLSLWTSWCRDVLLVQQGLQAHISNIDLAPALAHQASRLPPQQVVDFLRRLQAAAAQLNQNANVRLLLETLALRLPRPAQG
ncbi:MAG: DNA polymerase III subunit delta' [Caldilineales bacterium]|nr:DNA polymerase III subunit delta' [Caldilineales bacterium]MDW8318761.1 DNA polymerase III subunit delta' [Anaerolineae bacterium]